MSNQEAPPPYDEEKKSNMYPNPNTPYPPPPHGAPTHSNVGFATQHQPNFGGPPPNLGGPPPPTTQTTFVYVADHSFGPKSIQMTCPHCHQQVVTRVKYNPGLLTWLLVGGCIVFGFWLGCCLIPLCIDDCQDVEHFCPNCKSYLGQYKRI
uniref:LITAF domain-containing protein n=1 Tax=Acrobeloides nanus TaxID=290746 RepID=A0A914DYP4_9BILA